MSDTCAKCGEALRVGDFPFCPHGPVRNVAVIGDDIPGGQWFENGFDTPQKFYSHSEHRAALAARGLEIRAKWAGPQDKIMSRWDAVSADQLEKARELVSRPSKPSRRYDAPEYQVPVDITVTVTGETFTA